MSKLEGKVAVITGGNSQAAGSLLEGYRDIQTKRVKEVGWAVPYICIHRRW